MKKKLALVTGGYTGEAVISLQSAATVYDNLDHDLLDVYKIVISKEAWTYESSDGTQIPVNREDFSLTIDGAKINFDGIFMCIHGRPGEDGKLPGYFDMLGLPYTSCDATTSALTMNKRFTVAVANFSGIHVAKSVLLFKDQKIDIAAIQQLQFPIFVKPNSGGSSIGMSKVDQATDSDIKGALDKAFEQDDQVLIEEFIAGREFTIGVYQKDGEVHPLAMTEILKPENMHFFDYEAKYHGKDLEVTPAQVDDAIKSKIHVAAKRIYKALNCRGVIRIDFIYNEDLDQPYMLEVNTVPGETAASLVPQQVKASGMNLKEFYATIMKETLGF